MRSLMDIFHETFLDQVFYVPLRILYLLVLWPFYVVMDEKNRFN